MNPYEMQQAIRIKYKLDGLFNLLSTIEKKVFSRVKEESLLGKKDDIDLLAPALATSITVIREIICLCEYGFPDGALILARNVYEQSILCTFIEGNYNQECRNELLEKYFQDSEMTRLRYVQEQAKRFNNKLSLDEYNKLIQSHNEEYGSSNNNYWWSGKRNFREIADEVISRRNEYYGLSQNMHMEYKLASIKIHSSSFSNRMNIGSSCHGIDMRARTTGHENALFLATASMIPLVGYTYKALGLDDTYVISELNILGEYYLEMLMANNARS